ncbi:MAG: hypothetical protein P8Q22_02020 [Hellea sp.]|nr:hypothetical protein [Hellea sp.]
MFIYACATVDISNSPEIPSEMGNNLEEDSIVKKATSRLAAVFSKRRFAVKNNRKQMEFAAKVLLKGLSDNEVINEADQSYVQTANNLESTLSDIRIASTHVEKTVDSAKMYLNTAPPKKSYQEEITNLEQALIASRMALQVFEDALLKISGNTNFDEFTIYNDLVDGLRDVTNSFSNRAETN